MNNKNDFDKTTIEENVLNQKFEDIGSEKLILKDLASHKVYEINKFPFIIGRSMDCNLSFPNDHKLSRIHCIIYRKNNSFIIEDLGSTNGTRIDELLIKKAILKEGSIISVGDKQLVFLKQNS